MIPKSAKVIPRSQHGISRKQISNNALKVLYRLQEQGYHALLVGGGVRDLLLGREPKDFDVATNALPPQIKKCFANGLLIGRRFRLVLVRFKREAIEVSTFRGTHHEDMKEQTHSKEGLIIRDNIYGTLEEDANRRDFTVNALYYRITDFSVIDFHEGFKDLQQGILRMIGDPAQRYREDPVRMLRAVRFATKLGFRMETQTENEIINNHALLASISPARLFTEVLKLLLGGQSLAIYQQCRHYQLFQYLFPATHESLESADATLIHNFITKLFKDTDTRINGDKTVSPGYLLAGLLWHPLQTKIKALKAIIPHPANAFSLAYYEIMKEQQKAVAFPRNIFLTTRVIWELQFRMQQRKKHQCYSIVEHPRFRAAYDFLLLRAHTNPNLTKLVDWWKQFYDGDEATRQTLLSQLPKPPKRKRRKRKSDHE